MKYLKNTSIILLCFVIFFCFATASFGSDNPSSWGMEDFVYSGEADEMGLEITSSYVQGEEYYDEEIGEYDDSTVIGQHSCSITADKAGYYALLWESDNNIISTVWVHRGDSDPDDGTYKDSEYIYDKENHICGVFFYMSEGEREYAAITEGAEGSYSIKLAYLGKIENAESDDVLIRNTSDAYYDEEYAGIVIYPYVNVSFSEGQICKIQSYAISESSINSQTLEADVKITGESFHISVSLTDAEKLIESISFPEGFTPSCIERWNGTVYNEIQPDYMIVTLTDGQVIKLKNMEELILQNGRSYTACWNYDIGNEDGEIMTKMSFEADVIGETQKELVFRPKADSIKNTLADISKQYKRNAEFGWNLLTGKKSYEDYSKRDGIRYIFSIFRMMTRACEYYKTMEINYIAFTLLTAVLFASPILIIALPIIMIILIKKSKKKHGA